MCEWRSVQSSLGDAQQQRIIEALERRLGPADRTGFVRSGLSTRAHVGAPLAEITPGSMPSRLRGIAAGLSGLARRPRSAFTLAFGVDSSLCAIAAQSLPGRRSPVVTLISDLAPDLDDGGPRGRMARALHRLVLNRSSLVVVTSDHFATGYLIPKLAISTQFLELRNLPANDLPRTSIDRALEQPLTIGYFGLLRCERSLRVLSELVLTAPDRFRVLIAGVNLTHVDLDDMAERVGFEVHGPYRSATELASLYDRVDVSWTAYPFAPERTNMRLAKTNRFFEAAALGIPQIANADTLEGSTVEAAGTGFAVTLGDTQSAAASILQVSAKQWAEFATAAAAHASEYPSLDEEVAEISVALSALSP